MRAGSCPMNMSYTSRTVSRCAKAEQCSVHAVVLMGQGSTTTGVPDQMSGKVNQSDQMSGKGNPGTLRVNQKKHDGMSAHHGSKGSATG